MTILILHGPNLNLLGLESTESGEKITLDKVNRAIRLHVRNKNIIDLISRLRNSIRCSLTVVFCSVIYGFFLFLLLLSISVSTSTECSISS